MTLTPRPSMYVLRYLRSMFMARRLADEFGPTALAFLTAIVVEEDRVRHRYPTAFTAFTDAELGARIGCNTRTLHTVRKALVTAGLLDYQPARKGVPAQYQTTEIPQQFLLTTDEIVSKNCGESDGESGKCSAKNDTQNVENCRESGESSAKNAEQKGARYIEDLKPMKKKPIKPENTARKARVRRGSSATTEGEDKTPKERERFPMFDAIVELSGADAKQAGGRIAKLAHAILNAGIDVDRFRDRIRSVVARYAPWRKTLDLDTLTACWKWIITPPAEVETGPAKGDKAILDAATGTAAAGGKRPY